MLANVGIDALTAAPNYLLPPTKPNNPDSLLAPLPPSAGCCGTPALNHFTPEPTDVKVLFTKQGRSRRMAFVGYKKDAEAEWVKEVWQGAWLEGEGGVGSGSRIEVEWARSVQESAERESKYPRKRQRLSPPFDGANATSASLNEVVKSQTEKSRADDGNEKPTTVGTEPIAPVAGVSGQTDDDDKSGAGEEEGLSDMEYMRRRMKRNVLGDNDAADIENDTIDTTPKRSGEWEQDEEEQAAVADTGVEEVSERKMEDAAVLDSGRLFLRNLPYSVANQDLESLFSPFGTVSQIHIPFDSKTKRRKGLAYVTFSQPANALDALRALDQTDFQGRLLHILPAATRGVKPEIPTTSRTVGSKVKAERAEKRKEGGSQFQWGSLYMNSDAVANFISARFNISKVDLFDPSVDNAAVKLALAETSIISETKKYLEDQGINTAAFSSTSGPRSTTTLLAKNLPFGTSETTVKAMFEPFGKVVRMLFPPAGTIAVVVMDGEEAARKAFRGVSFKKIGNSVVYVEKGPAGMWERDPNAPVASTVGESDKDGENKPFAESATAAGDVEAQGEPGATLFVKNLSFSTTTDALTAAFRVLPHYLFSRVQTKPDPKKPNTSARLSMGFGFVGFQTVDSAKQAMKAMQGHKLDGHALELKFAQRGKEEESEQRPGKTATAASAKLVVKNVPFEATGKELRELFSAYGNVKSLRLPQKLDRKSRGFAFVEYVSKKEAENAMGKLQHTHLLGRHLVIGYAGDGEGEEGLEELRKKSGLEGQFLKDGKPAQKRKFQALDEGKDED